MLAPIALPDISIHAPREGGDSSLVSSTADSTEFQSTPPARGATLAAIHVVSNQGYFNPRPPRGGRPLYLVHAGHVNRISIHAPREGGDIFVPVFIHGKQDFNPRPPRGGRPQAHGTAPPILLISIHAPREGGDVLFVCNKLAFHKISIHAPREGGDGAVSLFTPGRGNFNPRPPRGGRRHTLRRTL